jgi:hypothetical protein
MGIADVCSHTLLDSEGLEGESMLRSKVSRAYLLTERRMVLPKICDDKRGFAKYLWKKLPEIRDDKGSLTLNTAELLPNICDNHHIFRKYLAIPQISGGAVNVVGFHEP